MAKHMTRYTGPPLHQYRKNEKEIKGVKRRKAVTVRKGVNTREKEKLQLWVKPHNSPHPHPRPLTLVLAQPLIV